MRLDRASGHLELPGDFRVVATLQQQFRNLLLTRAELNRTLLHSDFPLVRWFGPEAGDCLNRSNLCPAPLAGSEALTPNIWVSPKIHSMHTAKSDVDSTFRWKR